MLSVIIEYESAIRHFVADTEGVVTRSVVSLKHVFTNLRNPNNTLSHFI